MRAGTGAGSGLAAEASLPVRDRNSGRRACYAAPVPVLRLDELTWTEVAALDRRAAAAILPLAVLEAHGPHLPLSTDGIIARAMAEATARRLAERGIVALLLPPVEYAAAPFAAAFPGTLSIRPETVAALLVDIARALAAHEIRLLALANAHFDPAHLAAVHAGVEAIAGEGAIRVVFPDLTRKPWALRLGDEFRSGACHAGRFEGSIVESARPDLVRLERKASLAPNPASLSRAIREGKASFAEAGGPQAYFGDPAAATAEEGRATIATLGAILDEAILEAMSNR